MTDTSASAWPLNRPGGRAAPSTAMARWSGTQLGLLLALWIATHPYVGIVHDARLYALQALQASSAGAYSDDLFFRYGSQDKYTAFTALYGPLVGWLGPGQAHLLAFAAGQLLWFAALLWLVRVLFEPRAALLAAIAATVLDAHYGSAVIFQYGEIFATARLFSEALALCALALLYRRRTAASAACLLAAGLLHPLMAIAGAGVFAIEVGRRLWAWAPPARRLTGLAALGLAAAAVVVLGLVSGLLGRVAGTFDPAWFAIVYARSAYVFLANWTMMDWLPALATAAALATGVVVLARQRPALAAVLATACGGLLLGFLLGDLGRNVLVVNLQLWRCLWLAALFANITLGALAAGAERASASREFLWGALIAGLVSHFTPMNGLVRAVPILVALGVFWYERTTGRRPNFVARVVAGVAVALCLGWGGLVGWFSSLAGGWGWVPPALVAAAAMVLAVAPVPLRGGLKLGAAAVLLLCALALADARTGWQKFTESNGVPDDLRRFAETGGGLYWEGDPTFVWVKLRRPTYYACEHGSGAMFYRGTAMEFARRSAALRQLNTADFGANAQLYCPAKADAKASGPTAAGLQQACRANPDLDLLVLNQPVPGLPGRTWRAPASKEVTTARGRRTIDRFYAYQCSGLR